MILIHERWVLCFRTFLATAPPQLDKNVVEEVRVWSLGCKTSMIEL